MPVWSKYQASHLSIACSRSGSGPAWSYPNVCPVMRSSVRMERSRTAGSSLSSSEMSLGMAAVSLVAETRWIARMREKECGESSEIGGGEQPCKTVVRTSPKAAQRSGLESRSPTIHRRRGRKGSVVMERQALRRVVSIRTANSSASSVRGVNRRCDQVNGKGSGMPPAAWVCDWGSTQTNRTVESADK